MEDDTNGGKTKMQQGNLKFYAVVTVIAAVITACGQILAHNWETISRSDNAKPAVGTNPQIVTPEPARPIGFGKWAERQPNVTYKAESDGFVAVFTHGDSPPDEVMVHVGDKLEDLPIRTRAGRYDGTVCPVSKGHFWLVRTRQEREMKVNWLPISRRQKTGDVVE